MPEHTESLSPGEVKERLSLLFDREELRLVLLFGSAATGRTHRGSDIDLGFLFDTPPDIIELTNDVTQLLHTSAVDVVDLRRASPLLAFAAVEKGTVLYERSPGLCNEFHSLAFRRFVDTKKLREAQATYIHSFLEERGLA
jgi:predicted nucleotidyltransferase